MTHIIDYVEQANPVVAAAHRDSRIRFPGPDRHVTGRLPLPGDAHPLMLGAVLESMGGREGSCCHQRANDADRMDERREHTRFILSARPPS